MSDKEQATLSVWGVTFSSSTTRVRMALALKNVPYELKSPGSLDNMATEEYRRNQNPLSQMPVLELANGTKICQSVAILEYLEEVYPDVKLFPEDPVSKAKVRELVEIVNSFIQPIQTIAITKALSKVDDNLALFLKSVFPDPVTGVTAPWEGELPDIIPLNYMIRGLDAIEGILEATSGTFALGDTPTVADCYLIPQMINAKRYHVDVDVKYPTIMKVFWNVVNYKNMKEVLADTLIYMK
eukprot:Nitzschia sp. Nitz4//scaffold534_size3535//575//1297//NITZ4_009264-RA/size3535-processed-gene-0.0-mRNA-1//1//CDS//3329554121//3736//frame0